MIPGLLDSQIKGMSGRELARRFLKIDWDDDECTIVLGNRELRYEVDFEMRDRTVVPESNLIGEIEDIYDELARIIDSIREADRA